MDNRKNSAGNWLTFTTTGTMPHEPVWISDLVHRPNSLPQKLWDELDPLFNDFLHRLPQQVVAEDTKYPKCNSWTDEDGLHVDLAVPYVTKDNLDIDVDTRLRKITISGEAHQDTGVEYHKREISRTSFKRTFMVGQEFDLSKMTAKLEDGLLQLVVPHSEEEKTRYKKIAIK